MTRRHSRPGARSNERGSAYLITLLALVVLTILGLTLALVTQTELQIGGNERLITRAFYAADSGIDIALSRALVFTDHTEKEFDILDPVAGTSFTMRNHVEVSTFYPILDAPCNLCEINNQGSYADKAFRKINHAVSTTSYRVTLDPASEPIAQKTISAMMEVQPWKALPEAYIALTDPTQLDKIKF